MALIRPLARLARVAAQITGVTQCDKPADLWIGLMTLAEGT